MRCIIIDDEPAAREILKAYISDVEELQLVEVCKNAMEARTFLKENEVELLFLDINMPRLSGIDFLKTIENPPKVILTTAYSEYALEGYELDVIDYLLKPFSFERFLKAVDKAERSVSTSEAIETSITIKADGRLFRLQLEEILLVESQGDYLTIYTNDRKLTFYQTLKDFCERLPDHQFVRIHRSYLVSLLHIKYVEGNQVVIGDRTLPIGNSFKHNFLQKYTT